MTKQPWSSCVGLEWSQLQMLDTISFKELEFTVLQ